MRDLARKRSWSFRESLGYRRKSDSKSENSEASKTLDSTDSSDTRNANCQFSSSESSLYSEDILNSLISNSSYCGIPCSRLALVDPCQRILFKDLLKKSSMNSEFEDNYYFSWNVWTISSDDDEDKKLHLYSVIETEADLKVFIKNDLPKILNSENTSPPKIHIFKLGMNPNKNELPNGFTIEVRVHKAALKFLKKIAHFVFSNQVYNTESLKVSICGISLKLLTNYAVISIWIHPTSKVSSEETFTHDQAMILVEIFRNSVHDEGEEYWNKVVVIQNNNLESTVLNQDSYVYHY